MKSWSHITFRVLLLVIGTICFSCSHEEEGPGQNGKTGNNAYISFSLNTNPGVVTRTTVDYGTAEERKVSNIYMLLYEEGGVNGKLLLRKEIKATNTSGTFTGDDVVYRPGIPRNENRFVMKPIELEKQNYQLIILVNPTSTILGKAIEGTSTLSEMLNVMTNTTPDDYNNANGFFMSNAGGVVQVKVTDIKASEYEAELNPVSVPVERILAKVFVYENKNKKLTEVTAGGTIENVTWSLDVTNKQTYLIRNQDKLKGGAYEVGFISNRSSVYAADPNFTGNKNIISNETTRNAHFNILNPLSSTGFLPWNGYQEAVKHYQYILENTVSVEEQNATDVDPLNYMTHVVLKVIIKNPGKNITEDDYYSYSYMNAQNKREWISFTHTQAVEWYNGTFPSDAPASLPTSLQEAEAATNSPFAFEIINQVIPSPPTEFATIATTTGQVTFHKGGLNIYRIPIMHFGMDGVSQGDYGYYGVVRNNTYNLIINSIYGPGANTSDEGYLSSEIIINPWFERGWEVDLKPEV